MLPSKLKGKKSKQSERPSKIIPTGSDASSDSDEDEDDEDGPVTMANMEARSRALDAKTIRDAELDAEEMRDAEIDGEDDDDLASADEEGAGEEQGDEEPFQLPTADEREEEKKNGGPQVHIVQRRMRECVRVLNKFSKRAAEGRYALVILTIYRSRSSGTAYCYRARSEYVQQLVADIANYYGYNDFLAEKLFQLFPVSEVRDISHAFITPLMTLFTPRPLNSSKPTRYHARLLSARTRCAPVDATSRKPLSTVVSISSRSVNGLT